jgi:hypothetical protein
MVFVFILLQGVALIGQNKKIISCSYDAKMLKGQNCLIYADKDFNVFVSVKNNKITEFYGFDVKAKRKIQMGMESSSESVIEKKIGSGKAGISTVVKTCVECPMELCPYLCTDPDGKTVNCWCQSGPCKPVICKNQFSKQ